MPAAKATAEWSHGDHACAIFGTDEEHRDLLLSFVLQGLAANDRVRYYTGASSIDDAAAVLASGGSAVDRALADGQLEIATAEDSYLAEIPFDPDRMVATLYATVDDALSAGFAGLRVTGDMGWATRGVPGADRLFEYEQLVDEVLRTRPAAALCHYDARLFCEEQLLRAGQVHERKLEARSIAPNLEVGRSTDDSALQLAGEVDVTNHAELRRSLESLSAGPGDVVHLHLDELRFVDGAGARVITDFAQSVRPGRVVLHRPPEVLVRVLRLCWPGRPDIEVIPR